MWRGRHDPALTLHHAGWEVVPSCHVTPLEKCAQRLEESIQGNTNSVHA
jgi:hypothetical protein